MSFRRAAVLLIAVGLGCEGGAPGTSLLPNKLALWTGPTQLRGANIWIGRSYGGKESAVGNQPIGPSYPQSDFDRLAELGANYVNISDRKSVV